MITNIRKTTFILIISTVIITTVGVTVLQSCYITVFTECDKDETVHNAFRLVMSSIRVQFGI